MLFIIVHQAYELWFKQILWELDEVASLLAPERVAETDMLRIVARLDRITEIQKLLIEQISCARDDDPPRLPGVSQLPDPGLRVSERSVPADREPAGGEARGSAEAGRATLTPLP